MNQHQPTLNDTICAVSTPPGVGGIAVVRISGPDAVSIADSLWKGKSLAQAKSHTAHLGTVTASGGSPLDQAVATVYLAPRSFTGENVVELAVHGSRFVQRELLRLLIASGARLAEPGEFTRRAFIAGKMDLAEAEAVADVIASNSRAAHRIAVSQLRGDYSRRLTALRERLIDLASLLELELDFSEEDVEFASRTKLRDIAAEIHSEVTRLHRSYVSGAAIKEGIPVAIVGATNAGKSSLLNALLGDDRAIVSDIHGTTRDTIEETLEIGDFLFRFIDTAGLRDTSDTIERIGIQRSLAAARKARIVVAVIDPAAGIDAGLIDDIRKAATDRGDEPQGNIIFAINKSDITDTEPAEKSIRALMPEAVTVTLSAKTGAGMDSLTAQFEKTAIEETGNADEGLLVTNARHAVALEAAAASTSAIIDGLDSGLSGDLIALDLRQTIDHLASITGAVTSADILSTIFSRFCIGK